MINIAMPIILLTILFILVIQSVTVRIDWQKRLVISIDYMFLTLYFTVKKTKEKKKRHFNRYVIKLITQLLSHSNITLNKAIISFSSDDYAERCLTDGAIRGVLFPTLSTIKALSKSFVIAPGAIETRCPIGDDVPAPQFDISAKIRLYHALLSLFSFSKSYLKIKAKETK